MKLLQILILSFLIPLLGHSRTKDRVTMPDKIVVREKNLVLNGMGTRKATWLGVKVYVGGLYLSQKSSDVTKVLGMKGLKYIRMHFVRDAKKEKLVDVWVKAFKNSVSSKDHSKIKAKMDKFNSYMENVYKNEEIVLTFLDDGVEVDVRNKQKAKIKGALFSKALFSLWFVNPIDENLRDGLLGK